MGKRGGSYLGGSSILRTNAVPVDNARAKSKRTKKGSSSAWAANYLKSLAEIERDRQALRRYHVTSTDRLELGVGNWKWGTYRDRLRDEVAAMVRCGIHRADQIARIWNGRNFRTGSDQPWTPRLVKIAQQAIREGW